MEQLINKVHEDLVNKLSKLRDEFVRDIKDDRDESQIRQYFLDSL